MPLKRWKKLRPVLEISNPWWTYRHDEVLLPNGKAGEYHYVHVEGSSMIIPQGADGRLLLVNQYRYLCERESLEFPCGSVKKGSTWDETARTELAEETGFESGDLQFIGEFNPYNGVTDEMCRVYLARNLRPVTVPHDETEEFEQVALLPGEIKAAVRSGKIWDGMTIAGWCIAEKYFGL